MLVLLGLFLFGCGNAQELDDTGSTQQGVNEIVQANNQFAMELYEQLSQNNKDENIFFSPYSISTALAMTYEGAKGKTAEEMQSVLHIPEDGAVRRANIASLYNDINTGRKKYQLSTANALWAQKDYEFLQEYMDNSENYYGGKATNLDFKAESGPSRKIINSWVEEQTNDKIKDLIGPGVLNEFTRLVLTNAIYFKGTWVKEFDKTKTRDEVFTKDSGEKINVPMMQLTGKDAEFNYVENEEVQMLEMDYKGEELSMLLILPYPKNEYLRDEKIFRQKTLEDIKGLLTPEKISEWKQSLKNQRVDVYVPKFTFETKYMMSDTLKEMGIVSAFNPPPAPNGADFSGMHGEKPVDERLYISAVIHQAFVEVNEEGTEAAAATAVAMIGITSAGPTYPVFRADQPFIFIIRQKETGKILFLGRVNDPNE